MNDQWIKVILVMVGGSLGAVCRYGVSLLAVRLFGSGFAWGTLLVNLVGCFFIGVAFSLADRGSVLGPLPRLFFVTGFVGAFTTFSTFAFESVQFVGEEAYFLGVVNVLANNLLGVVLVVFGMWLGKPG